MNLYIYIGIGGFIGASLRYLTGMAGIFKDMHYLMETFCINIIGCFIMSYIIYSSKIKNGKIVKGLTTGTLGAFTTFSAFSGELMNLYLNGEFMLFAVYALLSAASGMMAAYFGYRIAVLQTKEES